MEIVTKARKFFAQNGRDIDKARFAYHFENRPLEELLTVLSRYQNADGGFGHALEVDIKAPQSNPFATELALSICLQAQVPRERPVLINTVAYLEQTQEESGNWRFAPAIYEHELAPWFQGWEWPNLNPACSLASLLKELGLGSARLHDRVEQLFGQLAKLEDLAGDEYYTVRPYASYFLPEWEHPQRELYRAGVLWWLIRQHLAGTLADSEHFFAYASHPKTYTARNLPPALVQERLDMLMGEQAEDGGWPSPYDPTWRGSATMQNLLVLQAFGRIEARPLSNI